MNNKPYSTYNNVVNNEVLKMISGTTLRSIADILSNTFGPFGSTTIIDKLPGYPVFSKDGNKVLSFIKYNGPIEESTLEMVREMAARQVFEVGDGSTTTIVSASRLFDLVNEIENRLRADKIAVPSNIFVTAFKRASEKYKTVLKNRAIPVSESMDELHGISAIAINNDIELGSKVADAYAMAGRDSEVYFQKASIQDIEIEVINGIKIDYGYLSDTGYNDKEKFESVLRDTDVIIFSETIEGTAFTSLFTDILNNYLTSRKPLTILAHGIGKSAMSLIDKYWSAYNIEHVNIVIFPQNLEPNISIARDIAICCDCKVLDSTLNKDLKFYNEDYYVDRDHQLSTVGKVNETAIINKNIENINKDMLPFIGKAGEITSNKSYTVIKDGRGVVEYPERIVEAQNKIKNELKYLSTLSDKKSAAMTTALRCRLGILKNKTSRILVGGLTDQERNATYDLIEDAVKSCSSALKYGYTQGGNYSLLCAFNDLIHNDELLSDLPKELIDDILRFMDNENIYDYKNKSLINDLIKSKLNTVQNDMVDEDALTVVFILAILNAYCEMINTVYKNGYGVDLNPEIIAEAVTKQIPYNVVTRKFDDNLMNSANTEIQTISSATSIISLLVSSNQFIGSKVEDINGLYGKYIIKD